MGRRSRPQEPDPVGDLPGVGRVDEGEPGHVAEPEARHLEDDRREVGAQDLGVGELGPPLEVLLGVQADADAVGEPTAAAGPLGGARLADGLDREALHLGALAVARDPRGAGVDDVANARHGERGLGDVGGQDDPAPLMAGEDPVLLGGRQPPEQRKHLCRRQVERRERLRGVADLAFARQEHENVLAAPVPPCRRGLGPQLLDRLGDAGDLVGRLLTLALEGAVAHLDRIGAPGDLDDRHRMARPGEVVGEPLGVDGGRGDDDLEVGAAGQQLGEVAEDEVDVEAALVGLVDDDGVVASQVAVALQLSQQDPVGHDLYEGVAAAVIGEPHLVADGAAQVDRQLLGDALRHRSSGDPSGLGMPDGPLDAPSQLQTDLGDLRGLA